MATHLQKEFDVIALAESTAATSTATVRIKGSNGMEPSPWMLTYSNGKDAATYVVWAEDGVVGWRCSLAVLPAVPSSGIPLGPCKGWSTPAAAGRLWSHVRLLEHWANKAPAGENFSDAAVCTVQPPAGRVRRFFLEMPSDEGEALENAFVGCCLPLSYATGRKCPQGDAIALDALQELAVGDLPVAQGTIWELRWPAASRDAACLALFNHEPSMMPELPFLFGMSAEVLTKRRERQRKEFRRGTSHFLDIVARPSGALMGVSGFRQITRSEGGNSTAEWGVAIDKRFRRQGVCTAVFNACFRHCIGPLDADVMTASTQASNRLMCQFLQRGGMSWSRRHGDAIMTWEEYARHSGRED